MLKKLILIIYMFSLLSCASSQQKLAESKPPVIKIIHPKQNRTIGAVDSTFILGNVTPGSRLTINGTLIPVHPDGGFLAFLPIKQGEFVFNLRAHTKFGESMLDWPVIVPEPFAGVSFDSLAILTDFTQPKFDQELIPGDLLELSFRGTPSLQASYMIENLTDWRDMTELGSSIEIPGSETVFGSDNQQDTILGSGVYLASLYLPDSLSIDSSKIQYRLNQTMPDSLGEIGIVDSTFLTAPGKLTIKNHEYPQIVELIDSNQTIRYGPRKGYLSIFQPRGVRFVTDGRFNNYIRLKLAPGQTAWIPDSSLSYLPKGTPMPYSEIAYIRTYKREKSSRVSVYLDEKLPFRVEQNPAENEINLYIYYATADTDWIRYDPNDDFIKYINWSQPQEGVYKLQIKLATNQIWGYEADYSGNTLNLDIKRPPSDKPRFKDLKIVIDPGHSSDPGSIGPTGFTEAEANLKIGHELARQLRSKGANVVMTRTGTEDVPIYDRPKIALREDCDVYISVHNNALPDAVNPYKNNGTSTYYYHLHSKPLAETILTRLNEKLGLNKYGLYHANFAVIRPTQYLDVLLECTFMILPDEEAKLRGDKFPKECAEAIVNGIEDFLKAQD